MVLSQQCVQSSQFDSQLVNAQCSDLSVLCVGVCVCLKTTVWWRFLFSLHLFQALRPAWPLVLESWPKGRTAFLFFPLLPYQPGSWHSFCINLEDLFVKRNVYGLKKKFFFLFPLILFIRNCSLNCLMQQKSLNSPGYIHIYKYIDI